MENKLKLTTVRLNVEDMEKVKKHLATVGGGSVSAYIRYLIKKSLVDKKQ